MHAKHFRSSDGGTGGYAMTIEKNRLQGIIQEIDNIKISRRNIMAYSSRTN